jgi:membrane protein DedA with SNARE-associated domain
VEATFIQWISTYGYAILFVWCILEGETALITAGIFSHTGDMNLALAIVAGALGGMAGDQFYFYIGRTNKNYIYKKLYKQRRKFAIAHMLLKQHGRKIVFLQRFLYGLRLVLPVSVGLTRYKWEQYILINSISSFLWATLYCGSAWLLGDEILALVAYAKSHWYFALPLLALFIGSIVLFFHKVEKHILISRSLR